MSGTKGGVISPASLAFLRGRKAFLDGKPMPPRDFDEDGPVCPAMAEWIGWMLERGLGWLARRDERIRRRQIRNWAERGGPLPPVNAP